MVAMATIMATINKHRKEFFEQLWFGFMQGTNSESMFYQEV